MAATPKSLKSLTEESLNGSWVEITNESPSHCRSTDNVSFEKIMMEVQNELIQLSNCGSTISHRNSPVNLNGGEVLPSSKSSDALFDEAEIERLRKELNSENFKQLNTDWIWYWKNESLDKRNYALAEKKLNLRQWAIRRGIFSKEVLSILLLTNVVSVALGVGIGYSALVRRIL